MKKLILPISVLLFSSCLVEASPKQKISGLYLGTSFGFTKLILEDSHNTKYTSESESSFQLLGGYQFNRIIGIEVDYTDYSDSDITSIAAQATIGYTFDMGLRPFVLGGLSSVNIDEKVNPYKDDTYLGFRNGVGLEYAPAAIGGWAIRVAYTIDFFKADVKNTNIELKNYLTNMSLGLNYKF